MTIASANKKLPRPGREGRKKETWPPIEVPNGYIIGKIQEWMAEHRESRRPLTVAGPLLALVCWLYEHNYPFPTRGRVAEAIGPTCTRDSVDSAVSTSIGYGEITELHRTEPGEVKGRLSIARRRYLIPSRALQMAYQDAKHQAHNGLSRKVAVG